MAINNLINIAKRLDNPEAWGNFWFYPAVLFSILSIVLSVVFGAAVTAAWAFGAGLICINAHLANRIFVSMLKKSEDT